MSIEFTQYIRPHGRKIKIYIRRPADIEAKAKQIIAAGYRFECEFISMPPGVPCVSLTIAGKGADVAIELCEDGPDVLTAVDKLITNFKLEA